jgi:DNA polymerase-3 subunit gamma/tau
MAHQSLYRRYRPRRFGELKGQEHVVKVLRNAVLEDRVGHAYLFSGPRGTGKTSSARILAKVLNCEQPQDGEPCGRCASCVAVDAGASFDVHELDAASNNGVDNIRDLIERASYTTTGRNKVYILDEVHMLSRAAEAALLKTLEEPPPHVVFVLATTDPQKVSPTIRSRTQHLEFHLLPADELEAHIRWVADDAGLSVSDEAIEVVLHMGAGSARDTLSALDQVVAAGGVTPELVPLDDLVEGLVETDPGRALAALAAALHSGRDPRSLAEELIAHLREGFLLLVAPELVQLPDRRRAVVADQAQRLGLPGTVRAMEVLGEVLVELRHAPDPRVLLDVALVKLTNVDADSSPSALLARIEKLERALAASPGPAVSPPPAQPPTASEGEGTRRARLGSAVRAATSSTEPAADLATEPAPLEPVPTAPVAAPAPTAAPTRAAAESGTPEPATGGGPNRDELTLAWADQILPRLSRQAKPVLAAGRWVDTDGGVALAVPNEPHRSRCEQHRAELEGALAAHFGRPMTVSFVVEGAITGSTTGLGRERADPGQGDRSAPGQPAAPGRREPADPDPDAEEAIDPAELIDAGPEHDVGTLERLAQAFPGAELVDEG